MWIGDVFGRERAERIKLDQLAELFFSTPEMPVLEDPSNHLILGSKGCGKSTVLRALTYRAWRQRAPEATLPFVGVYVPMSYDDINLFKARFHELQETEMFEDFFVSSVVAQICTQLTGRWPTKSGIAKIFRSAGLLPTGCSDERVLEYFVTRRQSALRDVRAGVAQGTRLLTLSDILNVSELFSTLARPADEQESRLGLLLDSFDYYGGLSGVLAPLFESDSGRPLVAKAAGRTVDVSSFAQSTITRTLAARGGITAVTALHA